MECNRERTEQGHVGDPVFESGSGREDGWTQSRRRTLGIPKNPCVVHKNDSTRKKFEKSGNHESRAVQA